MRCSPPLNRALCALVEMDMEITIRRIETESIEDKGIFETLFIEYLSGFSVELDLSVIAQLFALPYFHFISFVDNKPAGFAVCFESFSTYRAQGVMNIHDFMVLDNFRGKGVGKAQLNGIEQYCRDNDYLKITLEVGDDNVAAKKLYSSLDYEDYRVVLKGQQHWQKYLN
ncbi:LOW QUALITY PROTEIN: histone acetyltransferase HPA2 [Vibrio sp. JCM 18905]|nr:LOW QUALITY PROTEIN: histone acetyltransferase HPA2 [Vibrio sp. JCM 18905]